ncbi:hypothetical protein [Actinoplanes sp. HUAS TT8]
MVDEITAMVGALDIELTSDDRQRLTDLSDTIEIQGGRYPDFLEAQTNL